MTDSSKARLELILLLSLPRDPDVTTFTESGSMKNLFPVADRRINRLIDYRLNTNRIGQTVSEVPRPRLFQSQIIDSSMGGIVCRLPVEFLEEAGANN